MALAGTWSWHASPRGGLSRARTIAVVGADVCAVDLYWIPLGAGAGGALVRFSGRLYEAITAALSRRGRHDLYHSALGVTVDGSRAVIEMAPVWTKTGDRGVVVEGPVGSPLFGRSRLFRYEVRCWEGGVIPDSSAAVGGPRRVSIERAVAQGIIDAVHEFPARTWGRDEADAGEMWNSNSLVSWLLARAGLDMSAIGPPPGGRAPGWVAGLVVAGR